MEVDHQAQNGQAPLEIEDGHGLYLTGGLGGNQMAYQPAINASKRLRSEHDCAAGETSRQGEARSNAATATFDYTKTKVYQNMRQHALSAVQPAVSAAIGPVLKAAKASKHTRNMQQHLDTGTLPKFLQRLTPKVEIRGATEAQQQEVASLTREYQQALLRLTLAVAKSEQQEAETAESNADQAAQRILAQPLDSLPPDSRSQSWVTGILDEQAFEYKHALYAATVNAQKLQQEAATKADKRAAAAEAAAAEAGPVTLLEQVRQMVAAAVKTELKNRSPAGKGQAKNGKAAEQQRRHSSPPPARAQPAQHRQQGNQRQGGHQRPPQHNSDPPARQQTYRDAVAPRNKRYTNPQGQQQQQRGGHGGGGGPSSRKPANR
jgi:hypothetical protein